MLDFRNVLYSVITAIGIPVNLVAIVILRQGKCGLSKCITHYLLAMAVADLLVVVIEVLFYQVVDNYRYIWLFHHPSLYNIVIFFNQAPFCLIHYVLCHYTVDCSVWLTVAFTFDRFVAICSSDFKTRYCTPKIASLVIGMIAIGMCFQNIPFYFLYMRSTLVENGLWQCTGRPALLFSEQLDVFNWLDCLLNPLIPFFLILTLNTLTVRYILVASRIRRRFRRERSRVKERDPEMEIRRQSIILLFTLSASFLICWTTTTVVFILQRILSQYYFLANFQFYFTNEAGTLIQLFSCCTNTFIYGVTQSKFREQLKIMAFSPIQLAVNCVRNCVSNT